MAMNHMKMATSTSTKYGVLIIGVVYLTISGCSTGPNRAQRAQMQQADATEQKRTRNEELRELYSRMEDGCEKNGGHNVVITDTNGTTLLCASDYDVCVKSVLNNYFKKTKIDPPLSDKEELIEATKLCGNVFPDHYVPSELEKEGLKEGFTPLFLACLQGESDRIRYLLENGANPNERTKGGNTPLSAAALYGTADIVALLIDSGAKINAKNLETGRTPLMASASAGNIETARVLIKRGADTKATDNKGLTAIDIAKQSRKVDPALIRLLLKGGE